MTDMTDYLRGTVEGYLKGLSERKAVPGGGSASALTAAIGAGLNLMVLNYSIGPGKPAEEQRGLLEAGEKQRKSLECLSRLVDDDCRVFAELMEALSSGRPVRNEYYAASEVPMKICCECGESMDVTRRLVENGNMNLATDIGCASRILKSAFHSARLNVEVNLNRIDDRLFVERARKELDAMGKDIDRAEMEISERVEKIMKAKGGHGGTD